MHEIENPTAVLCCVVVGLWLFLLFEQHDWSNGKLEKSTFPEPECSVAFSLCYIHSRKDVRKDE